MILKNVHTSIRTHHLLLVMATAFAIQSGFYDVSSMLALIPERIVHGNEWWRIVSHIIAVDSWWIALLGFTVYFIVGRESEQLTNDGLFPIGLLVSSAILGLIYSILPLSCPPLSSGLFGILYSASLLMNISHSSALSVSAFVKLRLTIASTLLIGFGMVILTLGFFAADSTFVYKQSLEAGFGILSGMLTGIIWTHLRNAARKDAIMQARSTFVQSARNIPVLIEQHVRQEQMGRASLGQVSQEEHESEYSVQSIGDYHTPIDKEAMLNQILEKIYREDIGNLSDQEKEFLDSYSKSMK